MAFETDECHVNAALKQERDDLSGELRIAEDDYALKFKLMYFADDRIVVFYDEPVLLFAKCRALLRDI